jgi:glutamine synthetase
MAVLRKVALRHGLQALVHEKPFAGINGSGKHCNWSMAIAADNQLDGTNLLKPGKTPHQNIRFLLFLAAVLKGVHKHAGLLRAGIAVTGNEHRLGANEAPPAIISAFLGSGLTQVIEDIAAGKTSPTNAEQAMLKLGVAKLPEVEQDNTDRNRTSPFAFTGAKFEFRAVGASQSIAFPVMLLQAAVAEAIGELIEELKKEIKTAKSTDDAALTVVRKAFKETAAVRFEGNNYSDEWVVEAKKRGLPNVRNTVDALKSFITPKAVKLFAKYGVLSKEELHSRYHIYLEQYSKNINIEAQAAIHMVKRQYIPSVFVYQTELASSVATLGKSGAVQKEILDEVTKLLASVAKNLKVLEANTAKAQGIADVEKQSAAFRDGVATQLKVLRADIDALEGIMPAELWPVPTYSDLLFKL